MALRSPNPTPAVEFICKEQEKKGCPAHIEITQFDLYPEYSVHSHMSPNLSQKQARKIREESLMQAGYSQILYKPAHRGSPSQMPSYKGENGAFAESAPRAFS